MINLRFGKAKLVGSVALSIVVLPKLWAQPQVQFSNPAPISIDTFTQPGPDGRARPAKATPYPSTIRVTEFGPNERIDKVTVTLHELSHEVPDDIDIMLVGPQDQSIIIVSDAGGGFVDPGIAVTVTIDDDATMALPDDSFFGSGTFKPSNFEPEESDVFPDPALKPSSATQLSVFAGATPNGFWDLYVVDDDVFDAGNIAGGWTLTIRTRAVTTPLRRGDADSNAAVNLTDAIFVLNALFLGGPQPECADAADMDDSGVLNISDPVFLLDHLFRGGAEVPAPGFMDCGADPTPDELRCVVPCGS